MAGVPRARRVACRRAHRRECPPVAVPACPLECRRAGRPVVHRAAGRPAAGRRAVGRRAVADPAAAAAAPVGRARAGPGLAARGRVVLARAGAVPAAPAPAPTACSRAHRWCWPTVRPSRSRSFSRAIVSRRSTWRAWTATCRGALSTSGSVPGPRRRSCPSPAPSEV